MCLDIHTKFHKDWFNHSKVNRGGYSYRERHTQQGDLISLLLFFQNKDSGLKIITTVQSVIAFYMFEIPDED
jgi:hypothetical protein